VQSRELPNLPSSGQAAQTPEMSGEPLAYVAAHPNLDSFENPLPIATAQYG